MSRVFTAPVLAYSNYAMLAEALVVGGCLLGVLFFLFVVGAAVPLPPYPDLPGAEIDDNCPGETALAVPWAHAHSRVRKASAAAQGFNKLVGAGLLSLVDKGELCFVSHSRPVAIALIMECVSPILCPDQEDVFVHWYTNMALVYYIDDRIADTAMIRKYRKTLPNLEFADKALASVASIL